MRPVTLGTCCLITGIAAWAGGPSVLPDRDARHLVPQNSIALAEVLVAEDRRAITPNDLAILIRGLHVSDPELRRTAVRAVGRLERPSLIGEIVPVLDGPTSAERAEAANALGQALFHDDASLAAEPLLARLGSEKDPFVRGVVAQTLGRLSYRSSDRVRLVETALVDASGTPQTNPPIAGQPSVAPPATVIGVARGLGSLARRRRGWQPSDRTVARLRTLAVYGLSPSRPAIAPAPVPAPTLRDAARVRGLAIDALAATGHADPALLQAALADPHWQVRRRAARALSAPPHLPRRRELVARAIEDAHPAVRYEALQAYGRWFQNAEGCGPIAAATDDPNHHVNLLALDLLGAGCGSNPPVDLLTSIAEEAIQELPVRRWRRPAHALVALSRLAPEQATRLLPGLAGEEHWAARVYAARAATNLSLVALLLRMAYDRHHNVRQAALAGLSTTVGHAADTVYVAALGGSDYQLVRTAAGALAGSGNRRQVVPALLDAFARVSGERRETSRDVRVALLQRIGELGDRSFADRLLPHLTDFDPTVASESARLLHLWTGVPYSPSPQPLPPSPLPSLRELEVLDRTHAVVEMEDGGRFELRLLPHEAPTNAARFSRLARAGYYDGLTFHRVVPNFVIQGGSPGANEYAGDGPYTRDELTFRGHWRGTVGISTRGRDTGDAQIFVNLVDNNRLDHDYTIFAEVVDGMDVVDAILEAATVARITLITAPGN